MSLIADWRGREIQVARSSGGVLAVADPWDNVISTGVRPWPPLELVQKLYQSRQVQAFVDKDRAAATTKLTFYSDLQSIHSEDAITWSVFGPIVYAAPTVREAFVREPFVLLGIPCEKGSANLWLWATTFLIRTRSCRAAQRSISGFRRIMCSCSALRREFIVTRTSSRFGANSARNTVSECFRDAAALSCSA